MSGALRKVRWSLWLVVALAAGLFVLFAVQLQRPKDDFVRSQMIGKPVPQFTLDPALEGRPGLTSADLADGTPRLVNIFASWCLPCRAEAPQLEALRAEGVEIVGVAVRDRPEDIAQFLATYGDPFTRIGADPQSELQLLLGSSGVPETYVVDGRGVITYQHIGDIREGDVALLLGELREAGL